MAEYQVESDFNGLTTAAIVYDVGPPPVVTGVHIINHAPWTYHGEAQRSNGQWVSQDFAPGADVTLALTGNQFTITMAGTPPEPNVLPNFRGWYTTKPL